MIFQHYNDQLKYFIRDARLRHGHTSVFLHDSARNEFRNIRKPNNSKPYVFLLLATLRDPDIYDFFSIVHYYGYMY